MGEVEGESLIMQMELKANIICDYRSHQQTQDNFLENLITFRFSIIASKTPRPKT